MDKASVEKHVDDFCRLVENRIYSGEDLIRITNEQRDRWVTHSCHMFAIGLVGGFIAGWVWCIALR